MRYRVWHQKKWHHIIVIDNSVYNNNAFSRAYEYLYKLSNNGYWPMMAWIIMLEVIWLSTRR